jgi:hypothetical protein
VATPAAAADGAEPDIAQTKEAAIVRVVVAAASSCMCRRRAAVVIQVKLELSHVLMELRIQLWAGGFACRLNVGPMFLCRSGSLSPVLVAAAAVHLVQIILGTASAAVVPEIDRWGMEMPWLMGGT